MPHRCDFEFAAAIQLVGWGVRSRNSKSERVRRGSACELTLVFRTTVTNDFDWQIFVHIDGLGRRHNGDHDPVGGRYPTSLWQPSDVIVDRHELVLEPGALAGIHTLYVGMFRGSRRLEVTRGEHADNRVALGSVEIE
jgi:hypothetical protein